MGRDKALLPWHGGTFLSAAIQVLQSVTELVIVVAGENEANLEPVANAQAAFLIRNPNPEQGQFSSLQCGLREVLNRGRDAAIVTLVDRPAAGIQTVEQIKDFFVSGLESIWTVVPEYSGRHGHPIVVGREMMEAFLRAPASGSARDVEHSHQKHVAYLPVTDPAVVANVDTPEDFANLNTGL